MAVAEQIERKLREAFSPEKLEIIDESHLHAGHAGAPDGGESHFRIVIVAIHFEGMSRVARQRALNSVLSEELAGPVHALSAEIKTP